MLLTTALIWGASFVAQQVGSASVDAFTFTGIRTCLGALVLFPFLLIFNRKIYTDKKTLTAGLILGLVFSVAQNLQQFAFYYSVAGKIAFITAFYMFFVSLISVFTGTKIKPLTWLSIAIAITGLFFLCINPEDLTDINIGDALALMCAIFFACQIMLIDRFTSEGINGLQLSFMQFAVAGIISVILMFITEKPQMSNIIAAAPSLLYSGIMSCGIAYTLQILGQKRSSPVVASLLMSLESVFAVISAAIILKQKMTLLETTGCILMFAAIILSQVAEIAASKKLSAQNG